MTTGVAALRRVREYTCMYVQGVLLTLLASATVPGMLWIPQ